MAADGEQVLVLAFRSGAERRPIGLEENCARSLFSSGILQLLQQIPARSRVEDVALLRRRQRDPAQPAVLLEWKAHRTSRARCSRCPCAAAASNAKASTRRVSSGSIKASRWPRAAPYRASRRRW